MKRIVNFRTIWISDVHLGTRECRADFLLNFLNTTQCDQMYLVGDILDFWSMRRSVYWTDTHSNVLRAILAKASSGTDVIYIPGNHDEILRHHDGLLIGNVRIMKDVLHITADRRRLLVLHGDEFDSAIKCSRWISIFGSAVYDITLRLSHELQRVLRIFGMRYWSLATFLKHHIKNASDYLHRYDLAIAREVARMGVDGVICGHIHRARIIEDSGVLYCNTGDWVENCTALVEHHDGTLELIHWSDNQASLVRFGPKPRADVLSFNGNNDETCRLTGANRKM